MTFVAQPYERFADDLLTSLTGGMVREEHLFVGAEERYSLASPNVVVETVKVYGQRNNTYVLFERDIDYLYDAAQEAIAWKPDGKLPDDHSFFYLNYYRQEAQRVLTDRNPGSVTTTLAESFAREFAVLYKQMELIYQSAFVDLATGASLDYVAGLLALVRKDAKFAGGEALFKRSTPAPGDITIPAGTLISTDQGQNFETSDKRTLRKGQLSVAAPIRAQVEGPAGRADAGAIKNINRPIFGIESVSNEEATFFAADKETDEELRRRVKGTLERAGKSTLGAIKYSLIEEVPGINEGNVQVSEDPSAPGRVEVKFGLGSEVDPKTVSRIEESIFNSRAAGVRVVHNLPTRGGARPAAGTDAAGAAISRQEVVGHFGQHGEPLDTVRLPPELLAKMPEGVLPLRVEVLLRLTEQNLSASQKENIEDNVRARVAAYVEALPMGADLVYNKLLGQVVEPKEVADAVLIVRTDAVAGQPPVEILKTNLSTDGRKAKTSPHAIFVGLMGETVFIDALVQLQPKAGVQEAVTVSQGLDAAINAAIQAALASAGGGLTLAAVRAAVAAALAAADDRLQLTERNGVVINAEYEETGRQLNNTETVAVEEQQVLRPRRVEIQIPGELDG
jgi:uncharacterized phage protein gp47/JayE